MLKASTNAKEAYDKMQKAKGLVNEGKLDEAIALANEASNLDPKNSEAKTLKDKWTKDKEQITRHIDNINKFIKEKKFSEADKELQGAKSLHPKYPKVIEAEKILNEAKQRHQREVTDRLNESKRLVKEGKIDEAVIIVQEVAKIDKTTAQPVMNEVSAEAKKAGWDALNRGNYEIAIKRLEQAVALNPADTDAQKKLKDAVDYKNKMPLVDAKMKEFDNLIAEKKVVSSYQKLLEVQDILRTMAGGQSAYNPAIIKLNDEYNKLNKWYNELVQKTNSEWTRLFQANDWEKAEVLLKEVLKYEHTEANKKNYESSLQMVQNNLRERKEAMQYYEQAKANNAKGQPSDIKGIEDVTRELRNRINKFKPIDPEYKQIQELIAEIEKRKKAISAIEYAKTIFMTGDQFYRAYQYGNAAIKYEEGLKAIRDNADANSQLYVEYFTKWKDAVAKDSRYREIVNSLSNLLKNERPDETSIRNGIAMSEEGLKLVPNSAEIGGILHRLKIKLSEIQKQKELETQKKATADRLWDECSALAKQNRLNEALSKCRESLNYWSSDKRVAAVRDLENTINQETQKKATADRLWDECSALAKQNRLNEALSKCRESLNYWSSDKRVAAVRDLENTINQETQKKATADRLWDECSALAKQNRLNEALSKCRESLNYWSNEKRVAAVKDLENTVKQTTTIQTPIAPPITPPADPVHSTGKMLFNNGNISGVYNNPTKPTTFNINQPHVITLIQNYHWNNAKGSAPGTIGLRDQNGRTYGPWQSKGSPGQGGAPNVYWTVYPNITLPAGTYTIIDSNPSTWAQNSGSNGAGHTRIEGYPVSSAGNQQTGGQSTGNNSNQSQKNLTAEFKNSSGNQNIHIFVEGQDSFGPHNRITPGATIKVNIKAPSQGGFIKFAAGRNGQVLATCRWEYDPDTISGRMPVVTFNEPNRLSCTTGLR